MKSLIIFKSIHHNNTEKIANAIGFVLQAKLSKLSEVKPSNLQGFDLIGFGSGVYGASLDKDLFTFVNALQKVNDGGHSSSLAAETKAVQTKQILKTQRNLQKQ